VPIWVKTLPPPSSAQSSTTGPSQSGSQIASTERLAGRRLGMLQRAALEHPVDRPVTSGPAAPWHGRAGEQVRRAGDWPAQPIRVRRQKMTSGNGVLSRKSATKAAIAIASIARFLSAGG
jgi:hypothetical protein